MNIIERFTLEDTVEGCLVAFMELIEEWQSEIEGKPSDEEMKELHTIYDITEVGLRYIINNDNPPADTTEASDSQGTDTKPPSEPHGSSELAQGRP